MTRLPYQSNSGQVGIILLLITVVMLTVGISVVSRTTSDVNISTTNEQANRALDIAETGVERALNQPNLATYSPPPTTIGQVNLSTQVSSQRTLEATVEQGYTVGVDLEGMPASTVTIEWAKETACTAQASLVLTVFNFAGGANPPVRRYYVGPPVSAGCNRGDNFAAALAATTPGFALRTTVATLAGDELMRIRPLYATTDVRVSGANLPTQSYTIRSTAQNSTSRETKVVEVNRTLPIPPAVFDYVLFSGTSITQ